MGLLHPNEDSAKRLRRWGLDSKQDPSDTRDRCTSLVTEECPHSAFVAIVAFGRIARFGLGKESSLAPTRGILVKVAAAKQVVVGLLQVMGSHFG
jgi:hypothetical protein